VLILFEFILNNQVKTHFSLKLIHKICLLAFQQLFFSLSNTLTDFICAQSPTASGSQQQPAQFLDRTLLERYASIDSLSLKLERLVLRHEQTDHMLFNNDDKYKALMNEVRVGKD
jgi:hypothetical protein